MKRVPAAAARLGGLQTEGENELSSTAATAAAAPGPANQTHAGSLETLLERRSRLNHTAW